MNEENIIEKVRVPTFFKKRYESQIDDFDSPLVNMKAIRVNTLLCNEKKLINDLKKKGVKLNKIDWLDKGYTFESDFSMSSTAEYLKGFFYLQEAASQIPVQVLNPSPGELVLDMSAAPGSKTTQIASYMNNEGVLVALDNSSRRIEKLNNNIERMGVTNSIVYNKDARFANDLNIKFDKILLDAPCSGNYCVEDSWFLKRTSEDFDMKSDTQKQLFSEAFQILKKSGEIVYSTCSLEIEEDEEVVEWALETFNLKLIDTDLNMGNPGCTEKTKLCRKFWPHKTGTQGFFVAKFKKL
ncbi:hypothetical protein C0585_01640 [Candidatus Woesearchaeota archaeon]|nr:MAG: hypothetical protein C0585_01640 [Candidatus Woesearchaeota archaeon]